MEQNTALIAQLAALSANIDALNQTINVEGERPTPEEIIIYVARVLVAEWS